jgi:hypothetical protein
MSPMLSSWIKVIPSFLKKYFLVFFLEHPGEHSHNQKKKGNKYPSTKRHQTHWHTQSHTRMRTHRYTHSLEQEVKRQRSGHHPTSTTCWWPNLVKLKKGCSDFLFWIVRFQQFQNMNNINRTWAKLKDLKIQGVLKQRKCHTQFLCQN